MARRRQLRTLILTTSITAVRQWMREMLDKTTLHEDQVGEYTASARRCGRSRWPPTRS